MDIRYLIKNLFYRRKIIILLILQTAIFTYFLMNFFTIKIFRSDFVENYKKSFNVETGAWVSNFISGEDLEGKNKNAFDLFDYIENNSNIKSYKIHTEEYIPEQQLGIKYSKYCEDSKLNTETGETLIPCFKINYSYFYDLKKYISGSGFSKSDFQYDYDVTPLILGSNFKEKYKVGESIITADKKMKFKVVGFLNERISILHQEPIFNAKSLQRSFIVPLNKKELNISHKLAQSLRTLTVEFKDGTDLKKYSKLLEDKAQSLGLKIQLSNFNDPLNKFLRDFDSKLKFELVRVSIFTILAFGALTLSFVYLINTRKKEIGILYSIGASNTKIISMLIFDVMFIVITSYLISLPIYIYNGKAIFSLFSNQFNVKNFILGLLFILFIGITSLLVPCYKIIKLKPRELIGGFRE